jgi:hypothetical protein
MVRRTWTTTADIILVESSAFLHMLTGNAAWLDTELEKKMGRFTFETVRVR